MEEVKLYGLVYFVLVELSIMLACMGASFKNLPWMTQSYLQQFSASTRSVLNVTSLLYQRCGAG